ncbi:MAG: diguanylate cyclase [Lysobacteraceae bacterium]
MASTPAPDPVSVDIAEAARLSDLDLLPRRVFRLRMLGMGLGGLCIAAVLYENQAPPGHWLWMAFTALVWPHLALQLALRSRSPYRAELRNLMFDSVLAAIWVPLLSFNLLPSALLLTLAVVDKINTGIRGLWLWSLPGMLAGFLGAALLTGFDFRPHSSTLVILACLPMLLIHTIAVSLVGYRLVRKVQRQNRMLDELSRVDVLTGLSGRRHWQQQAELLLKGRHQNGQPRSLLMIDIDLFKEINDSHGHAVGDDVLRAVAAMIRRHLEPGDVAGRFGGDEFAAVLEGDATRAAQVAERIRSDVAGMVLPHAPHLRCSVSLGHAQAEDGDLGLREWLESADRALYSAKQAGRNRSVGRPAERRDTVPALP